MHMPMLLLPPRSFSKSLPGIKMDRNRGSQRGSRGGGGYRSANPHSQERQKKESVLNLEKFMEKQVHIKFAGGREVIGTLKGVDPLLNIVLDDTKEYLRDIEDNYRILDEVRELGLVVCRGPSVMVVSPVDGTEEIANPFIQE